MCIRDSAKNYVGDVVVYGDSKYKYTIDSLAYTNEVGAYNPSYYNKGKYTLEYKYILRPPIQYDDEFSHLNLKFLREHIPIKKFKIILPKEYIVKIYPHPPNAVSYTHLDVYKRQKLDLSAPEDSEINIEELARFIKSDKNPVIIFYGGEPLLKINKIKDIMDNINVPYRMPVSYTHLDVYKRQVLHLRQWLRAV